MTMQQLRKRLVTATHVIDSRLSSLSTGWENRGVRSCMTELEGELNAIQAIIDAIDDNPVGLNIITEEK